MQEQLNTIRKSTLTNQLHKKHTQTHMPKTTNEVNVVLGHDSAL